MENKKWYMPGSSMLSKSFGPPVGGICGAVSSISFGSCHVTDLKAWIDFWIQGSQSCGAKCKTIQKCDFWLWRNAWDIHSI